MITEMNASRRTWLCAKVRRGGVIATVGVTEGRGIANMIDPIANEDEIFGFMNQSHISKNNSARLQVLVASSNSKVADLADIVLQIARICSSGSSTPGWIRRITGEQAGPPLSR